MFLAGPGNMVEIEQNLLNNKIKTLTAYYGEEMIEWGDEVEQEDGMVMDEKRVSDIHCLSENCSGKKHSVKEKKFEVDFLDCVYEDEGSETFC